jgi:hypothetical protein
MDFKVFFGRGFNYIVTVTKTERNNRCLMISDAVSTIDVTELKTSKETYRPSAKKLVYATLTLKCEE